MIPGISTGGGGFSADLGGGPSSAGAGDNSAGGNTTWNFAPPSYQVQAQSSQAMGQQWQTVAIVGGVILAAWLFTRK